MIEGARWVSWGGALALYGEYHFARRVLPLRAGAVSRYWGMASAGTHCRFWMRMKERTMVGYLNCSWAVGWCRSELGACRLRVWWSAVEFRRITETNSEDW